MGRSRCTPQRRTTLSRKKRLGVGIFMRQGLSFWGWTRISLPKTPEDLRKANPRCVPRLLPCRKNCVLCFICISFENVCISVISSCFVLVLFLPVKSFFFFLLDFLNSDVGLCVVN